MNSISLFIILFSSLFITNNPELTINISNIEKVKGEIRIGVFNKKEGFLKEGNAIKEYVIAVDETSEQIIVKDLPKGEYAVSLYHDANSDEECNRNFFGIPKEGYGFSNNIKPKLSAPKYEDCKFLFQENKAITIKLIN